MHRRTHGSVHRRTRGSVQRRTHGSVHRHAPPQVRARLVPLHCESGAFLIYRLLRHAQAELRARRWACRPRDGSIPGCAAPVLTGRVFGPAPGPACPSDEYVFYTEADQVLHLGARVPITALARVLDSHLADGGRPVYLVPNRLEQIYQPATPKLKAVNGDSLPFRGPNIRWQNATFALVNMCDQR